MTPFHICRHGLRGVAQPGPHRKHGGAGLGPRAACLGAAPPLRDTFHPVTPGTGTAEASWHGPCPQGMCGIEQEAGSYTPG